MKLARILTLFLGAALVGSVLSASCSSGVSWVWPPSGAVPSNAVLLLNSYGDHRSVLEALGRGGAELRGDDDAIPLEPVRRYEGQFRVSQALLRPSRNLAPGVKYRLYVPSLVDGPLGSYTFEGFVPYEWISDGTTDLAAPVPTGKLTVVRSRNTPLGCGPVVELDVRVPATETNQVLALVQVVSESTTEPWVVEYLLPLDDGVLTVGHGMCSGAFRLQPGESYTMRLNLVDVSGNQTMATMGPLSIIGPLE